MVTVSIVSHGHAAWVSLLLQDLTRCPEISRIILTLNVEDSGIEIPDGLSGKVICLHNIKPKGFGANHNGAFRQCNTPYFCILNPDIRLGTNPFPELLQAMNDSDVALVAPISEDRNGNIQDSVRYFPKPRSLLVKILGWNDGRYSAQSGDRPFPVEWVSGMFMLIRSSDYRERGGFDEKYYLYYEDVDLCVRLWKSGRKIVACPQVRVVHEAQRASHHNLKHLRWHLSSLMRYFYKYLFRLPRIG